MAENKLNQIIIKAIKDKKFCEELKQNPKKVLERELKITLPKDVNIKVLEESESQKYLVIPLIESDQLAEEQIQNIVGGVFFSSFAEGCRGGSTFAEGCRRN